MQVVLAPCSDPVLAVWQVYVILDAARNMAAARDLHVTAAPKPLRDFIGNGMHVHVSLAPSVPDTQHGDPQPPSEVQTEERAQKRKYRTDRGKAALGTSVAGM
jgi:hypothetical protein